MDVDIQKIYVSALQLPERDRADLAASLLASIDRSFDSDTQTAWAEEIDRRLAELGNGTVNPIPWKEARQVIASRV